MSTFPGWESQVLRAIGAPVTKGNVAFLDTWQRFEGGSANFNPLNTTQPAAGSSNYNSVGVKNYTSAQQGVAATAATLQNGRYNTVVSLLRTGNPSGSLLSGKFDKTQVASEISTWGTKTFANNIRNSGGAAILDSPAQTAGNAATSVPGVQQALDAGGSVVDAGQAVGGFLSKITSLDFLIRAGQVLGGAALVGMGSFLLAKQIGLVDAATSVAVPELGAAKAVAGASSSKQQDPFEASEQAGYEQAARADARKQGRQRFETERRASAYAAQNNDTDYDEGIPF